MPRSSTITLVLASLTLSMSQLSLSPGAILTNQKRVLTVLTNQKPAHLTPAHSPFVSGPMATLMSRFSCSSSPQTRAM